MDRVRTSVNELSEQYGLELKCLKSKFRYNLRSQKRFVACEDCRASANCIYTPPVAYFTKDSSTKHFKIFNKLKFFWKWVSPWSLRSGSVKRKCGSVKCRIS